MSLRSFVYREGVAGCDLVNSQASPTQFHRFLDALARTRLKFVCPGSLRHKLFPKRQVMVLLQVPSLRESPFNWLRLALWLPNEQVPTHDINSTDEYLRARADAFIGGSLSEELLLESRDEDRKVDITLDRGGDDNGLRVELVIANSLMPDGYPRNKVPLEDVLKSLSWFEKLQFDVTLEAAFWVNRSKLPVGGVVDSMVGVRLTAGGEDLLVTGAQWTLRAFQQDYISWSLYRQPDDDFIGGKVVRRSYEAIQPSLLVDGLYLATTRFNRFILQQSESPHAVQT